MNVFTYVLGLIVIGHSNHWTVATYTGVNEVSLGRFRRQGQSPCNTTGNFLCSSGQCISQNRRCDGVKDCSDGSDETAELCKNTTECSLHEDRGNRLFCHFECQECSLDPLSSCAYPSTNVPAIKVQCIPGYRMVNGQEHAVSVCINRTWVPSLPECQKSLQHCPPLTSETLEVTCFNQYSGIDCSRPMLSGSKAEYHCSVGYREFPNLASAGVYRRTLTCRDGKWTHYLPVCEPICGFSKGDDTLTPLIVNGTATKLGQFPWHVALYRRNRDDKELWDNICGGSLISHRVILTAATCVVNPIITPTDFRVALGKYYRDWAREETNAIWRNVVSIKLPPEFQGAASTYLWDIALLLMNATVQFNSFVMPVCMNLDRHLNGGDSGYVVGWGKTTPDGIASEVPLYRNITIMAEDDCYRSEPTIPKIGRFCGMKNTVSPVQSGDSGGGLYAIDSGLHYIFGIANIKVKEIPLFINISWISYRRWITEEMKTLDNEVGVGCVLPAESENRKYCTLQCTDCEKSACSYAPGSKVSDYVIKVQCDRGYHSSDNQGFSTIACINGSWTQEFPKCQITESTTFTTVTTEASSGCSLPENPSNRLFCPYTCQECSLNPLSSCAYPSPNVQAIKVQCTSGYGLVNALDLSFCINNAWIPSLPECQKVCPPLDSEYLEVTCFNQNSDIDCSQPMVPGSMAKYQCRQSHREFPSLTSAGIYKRTLICRRDGTWNSYLPECKPICGVSKGDETLTPTIVNGTATKLGQFPWHAALYKRNSFDKELWENICGGSLISQRVVLTAAHCLAGITTTPADLRIALGKQFRDWAKEEKDAIRRDVVFIKLPPAYRGGATSYTWDVALLLMNATVQFNSYIMPVCMNLEVHHPVSNGNNGYVVGWGKTAPNGIESEVLLYNNITIMAEQDCQRSIALFLSFDKFCGIRDAVSVVQQGDSGGGLTAVFGGLHYIIGIVSIKSKEIPMFTNISWHFHRIWIDREMLNIVNLY